MAYCESPKNLLLQISMSVLRILMVVPKSAQTLPEVISVHVTMGTDCQAMAYGVLVSNCKVEVTTFIDI